MNINTFKLMVLIPTMMILFACNSMPAQQASQQNKADTLIVHIDGKMEYRQRLINQKDVVIYPDGFGGERAAVKMRVPLHPPFYRDTIIVERISEIEHTPGTESVN